MLLFFSPFAAYTGALSLLLLNFYVANDLWCQEAHFLEALVQTDGDAADDERSVMHEPMSPAEGKNSETLRSSVLSLPPFPPPCTHCS